MSQNAFEATLRHKTIKNLSRFFTKSRQIKLVKSFYYSPDTPLSHEHQIKMDKAVFEPYTSRPASVSGRRDAALRELLETGRAMALCSERVAPFPTADRRVHPSSGHKLIAALTHRTYRKAIIRQRGNKNWLFARK